MNGTMDMLSVANGAKKKSSAAPIRRHRLKSISGKFDVAEGTKVPDNAW